MFKAFTEAGGSKEATLVVELMARFDEASNIRWARAMEDAGVQVYHGVVGLKTHCKLALLVRSRRRRRDTALLPSRHGAITTPSPPAFYTDLSLLLTADPAITEKVHMVFSTT